MAEWQDVAVVAGSFVFVLYLLWQMRPVFRRRAVNGLASAAWDARVQARAASTPRARALAFCSAGDAFASQRGGLLVAVAHYLRAMRADRLCTTPLDKLAALLRSRRPRLLERILWRRLGSTEWQGESRAVALHCARLLSELYRHRLRSRTRAQAFDRIIAELEPPRPLPAPLSREEQPGG